MLRLSRSNPRKKYEIDIKCDCEDPEKSGECMKDMTLRRPVNSKPPNARKLSPPNPTGTPNQFSTVCAARERSPLSNSSRSSRYWKRFTTRNRLRTPNVKGTANCGHFHPGSAPDGRANDTLK